MRWDLVALLVGPGTVVVAAGIPILRDAMQDLGITRPRPLSVGNRGVRGQRASRTPAGRVVTQGTS